MDILADPEIETLAREAGFNQRSTQKIADEMEEKGKTQTELKLYLKKIAKKRNTPITPAQLEKLNKAAEEHEAMMREEAEIAAQERDKEEAETQKREPFIRVFEYPDGVSWDYIFDDKFQGLPNNLFFTSKENPNVKIRFYDKIQTGPTKYFVMDLERNICEIVRIGKVKMENDVEELMETGSVRQASFSMSDLKIYPAIPEIHTTEAYSFTLRTKDNQNKRINSKTVDECVGEIKTRGLFEATHKATDTFNRIVKCLKNCEEFKVEVKPPKHGFFLIKGELVSRRDFNSLPSKENLNTALELLEDFGDQYGEIKDVFGFMVHWHIMAPFNFALKQQHGKDLISTMPYILFYGTSRLGKDTIANFGSFIWRKQLDSWSKGQIHSEPQLGEALSEGSYPIIVSEGEDILLPEKRGGFSGMIKDAAEGLRVRRKMINGVQTTIPSLSLMVITSNTKTIDTAALSERVGLFDYGTGKRRTLQERKAFTQRFWPTKMDGPLEAVGAIGDFVGNKMMNDPRRIKEAWFDTSVKLLHEMYEYTSRPMPEWLKKPKQPQRLEEGFEREDENYVENILSYIIRDVRIEPKKEKIEDENGNLVEYREHPVTRRDKAEYVVQRNFYPWIFRRQIENKNSEYTGDFVYLSKSIETDLHRDLGFNIGLEKIADLLNGEYKRKLIKNPNGKESKKYYAIFEYEDFMKMYSEIGENDLGGHDGHGGH